jgi:hypothetical protein
MKNIDQLNSRIRGNAYIEKKLTLGQRVKFLIEGDVIREETEDNQDGSVNICYIIHPMSVEDLGDKEHPPSIEPLPVFSQEELDDILGNKEPVDTKDIPF